MMQVELGWNDLAALKVKILSLEKQITEARELLEAIVCTKEPDIGIVLVSHESATYWCHDTKAWVYKHARFSPLGDALIQLHEKLLED
tara:strand:- start:1607 stop:1870 length:264 start_codon:yes stop_codon:yes gene_type:complete